MNRPSPSAIWVLIDEDYRSINDAAFAVTLVSSSFLHAPASYHGVAWLSATAIRKSRNGRMATRSCREIPIAR